MNRHVKFHRRTRLALNISMNILSTAAARKGQAAAKGNTSGTVNA